MLCFRAFYPLILSRAIVVLKLDLTHPLVVTTKLVSCNVKWFFDHNMTDWWIVADILEVALYSFVFWVLLKTVGFAMVLVLSQSIKGVHRVLTNTQFGESVLSVGHDLRLPLVNNFAHMLSPRSTYSESAYDIFDHRPGLYRNSDIRGVLENLRHTYCENGDAPVSCDTSEKLLCERRSQPGINSVPINGGYLSWEWHDHKICLYVCSHVIVPKPGLDRLYRDVYVATFRTLQKKVMENSICSADSYVKF